MGAVTWRQWLHTRRGRAYAGTVASAVLTSVVTVVVAVCAKTTQASWFRFGPGPELDVAGIRIDTWPLYAALLAVVLVVRATQMLVEEVAMPVFGFTVYNPDNKLVRDFRRGELQVLANVMFCTSSLRELYFVLLTVSQVDIAVVQTLASEFTSVGTIYWLLLDKQFPLSDQRVGRLPAAADGDEESDNDSSDVTPLLPTAAAEDADAPASLLHDGDDV